MTPEDPSEPEGAEPGKAPGAEDSPQGVFGNLPHTRPGARSPRRETGAARPRRATSAAAGDAKAKAAPPSPEDDAARALTDSEPAPAEEEARGGGLEDVAWAGVAAAAEAATIGVRLATRALEAMRDAVDRR